MIDPVFQSTNYQLARKLLDAAALRHEAIATNIANAETPGFRRLDVGPDFAQQLRAQVMAGELSGPSSSLQPKLSEDTSARSLRPDGNTVEIEASELAGRLFQHELDHLDGVLMFDRMTPEQRKEAMAEYRRLVEGAATPAPKRRLRLT
jgi:flagellar basal-body rod protein FlgB